MASEVEEGTYAAFRHCVIEKQPVAEICGESTMTANQVHKVKWRMTQKRGEKMRELLEAWEQHDEHLLE